VEAAPVTAREPSGHDIGGRETARKLVHAGASLAAAAVATFAPGALGRGAFAAALLVALAIEAARRFSPSIARAFDSAVGTMLRHRERRGITGATTLATGFAATALLAPAPFAAAGILAAGLGDAAAALVGRHFGRLRLPGGKSLEGAIACFATALLVSWPFPGIPLAAAVLGACATAIVEIIPLPVDDNLVLPIASAGALWAGATLL
jgi:dolichol kinase